MRRPGIILCSAALVCAVACSGGGGLQSTAMDCTQMDGSSAVDAVTASNGNPALAVDGNAATAWSCTSACWIAVDLGSVRTVDAVELAWAGKPATRFSVSVSDDGTAFTPAVTGVGASCQRQSVDASHGRFVRVAVDADAAAAGIALAELRVSSSQLVAGAPPPNPPLPVPSPPAAAVDAFGVSMLYPSRSGGESWTMSNDPLADPRFDPQNPITRNSDGSWKMKNVQVRMEVFTSTGYDGGKIRTYDRDALTSQGYMLAPNDWRNVEMTGYVRVNSASDPTDNFAWYARGGRHTDSVACEGSSYKGGLHYDGRVRFEKESWHVSYRNAAYRQATASIMSRWVGFKSVMRNIVSSGKPAVKMELWLNDSADRVTWSKVYELIDDGSLGGDASPCGAVSPALPITWGGPIATFRWDNAQDVDFRWLTVREIE